MIIKTFKFHRETKATEVYKITDPYMADGFLTKRAYLENEKTFVTELQKPENDLDRLEIDLQKHDWFYQMSDDYGVYCRGSENEKKLLERAIELGPKGLALYNEYEKKAFAHMD